MVATPPAKSNILYGMCDNYMSTQHICIVESLTGEPAAKLTY